MEGRFKAVGLSRLLEYLEQVAPNSSCHTGPEGAVVRHRQLSLLPQFCVPVHSISTSDSWASCRAQLGWVGGSHWEGLGSMWRWAEATQPLCNPMSCLRTGPALYGAAWNTLRRDWYAQWLQIGQVSRSNPDGRRGVTQKINGK